MPRFARLGLARCRRCFSANGSAGLWPAIFSPLLLLRSTRRWAGTVSTNPVLFILATWLVLAWRVAGYWGLDRWVLPALGVPGHPGRLFERGTAARR